MPMSEHDTDVLTTPKLAAIGGVSMPFASQVLNNHKKWPVKLAIKVYRVRGDKYGPIVDLSEEDIDALERFEAMKPARSA